MPSITAATRLSIGSGSVRLPPDLASIAAPAISALRMAAGPAPLSRTYEATMGIAATRRRRVDHPSRLPREAIRPRTMITFSPLTTTMWMSPAS